MFRQCIPRPFHCRFAEFANHMPYMCKFRPVFRPVKMWAHQSKMKDPGYGIVFKLIKVEVEPSNKGSSAYQNYLQGDVFVDDDEDEQGQVKPPPAPEPITVLLSPVVIASNALIP